MYNKAFHKKVFLMVSVVLFIQICLLSLRVYGSEDFDIDIDIQTSDESFNDSYDMANDFDINTADENSVPLVDSIDDNNVIIPAAVFSADYTPDIVMYDFDGDGTVSSSDVQLSIADTSGSFVAVIPSNVTAIGDYVFSGLNRIVGLKILGGSLTAGDGAFYECYNLRDLYVSPDTDLTLGDETFGMCGFTSLSFNCKSLKLGVAVFSDCYNLEYVEFPVNTVFNSNVLGLFSSCESIKVIDLSRCNIISAIGTFTGCGSLTKVSFPPTLTSFGNQTFSYCYNLEVIEFYGDAPTYVSMPDRPWFNTFSEVNPNLVIHVRADAEGFGETYAGFPVIRTLSALDLSDDTILDSSVEYLELLSQTANAMYIEFQIIRILLSIIIVYGVFKILYSILGGWFFGGI